ncbi:MAG TPA: hypothetical protein VGB82_15790 [Alphaproteobacteria bacterium]
METRSLRKWLRDRGCKFSQHKRAKSRQLGPAGVTVTCGRHTAELPEAGPRKELAPEVVENIVQQLGLNPAELPRYQSRV